MANEVAVVNKFDIVTGYEDMDAELLEELQDEMEDLDEVKGISCKKIKIPSGGGIAFEVETDDPESPDSIKELEAVVIFTHRINSYWAESFGGSDNKAPDCSSFDSKKGVVLDTGEIRDCDTCPYNEYGENGTGKPCKNMRRMYLLLSGKPGVYLLSVPPTSIKEVNNQLARLMGGSKIPYSRMVLKFKLTKDKNKNGIVYSKVGIERVGMLPQEYFKTTAAMRKELKEKYKEVVITSDDYTTAPADPVVDKEGFMDVDAAGDIPEELPFN